MPEPGRQPLEERAMEPPRFPTYSQLPRAMSISQQRRRGLRQARLREVPSLEPHSQVQGPAAGLEAMPLGPHITFNRTQRLSASLSTPSSRRHGRKHTASPVPQVAMALAACVPAISHVTSLKPSQQAFLTLLFRWGRRLRGAK